MNTLVRDCILGYDGWPLLYATLRRILLWTGRMSSFLGDPEIFV